MNFCPNCGAENDKDIEICPYCGYSFTKGNEIDDYKNKITQLEQKITQLEKKEKPSLFNKDPTQMKYFWIMATIMVIAFFAFIFFFVYMARH